jgi:hypothetical protein
MLPAIQLDDQPSLHANKVDNVTPDWMLPAELDAAETAIP